MAGRDRRPAVEDLGASAFQQPAMPGMKVHRVVGRCERAIGKAIKAAVTAGTLDPDIDGLAVAVLRSNALAIDACERNGERHTQALLIARMSELLTKLRLEPSSRGEGVTEPDAFDRFLADIGTPSTGDGTV